MNQSVTLTPPPFDTERMLETLAWLRRQTPEQQSATFAYLQSALGEASVSQAEKPHFAAVATAQFASPLRPLTSNAYEATLPPFDPEGTIAVLQSFYEGDPEEHRETLEALMKALNETRAANGERLLFPDDNE